MCEDLIEPNEEFISSARNTTELSLLGEKIILTFLKNNCSQATVRADKTKYNTDDLYKTLYRISQRKALRDTVSVRLSHQRIILVRNRT